MTTRESPGHEVFDQRRRMLAAALIAVITAIALEGMSVAPVLPVIEADLHGIAWYGWVFSAFSLAQILAIPLTGLWLDRANPAVPMVWGFVVFFAGLGVATAAPTMPVLVAARVLQGLGAGIVPAVAYVAVGRGFTEALRPRAFALISTAWVVPSLVGPALAPIVTDRFGWRWVFGGMMPLSVLAAAFAFGPLWQLGPLVDPSAVAPGLSVPGGDVRRSQVRRVVAAFVLVAGVAVFGSGLQARSVAVLVATSLVGFAVSGWALVHLTPTGTLRLRRGLPAAVALRGLLTMAFFSADGFLSLMVTELRHASTRYAGVAFGVSALTWAVASWTQERLARRVAPRVFIRSGFLVLIVGSATLMAVAATGVPLWWSIVGSAINGLGIGLAHASLSLVVLNESPVDEQGFSTAALQLTDALGSAVGTGAAGAVVAVAVRNGNRLGVGLTVVFAAAAVVAVLGVLASVRLGRGAGAIRLSVPGSAEPSS